MYTQEEINGFKSEFHLLTKALVRLRDALVLEQDPLRRMQLEQNIADRESRVEELRPILAAIQKWENTGDWDDEDLPEKTATLFDLIFFHDNNEDLPFIGRKDFKNDIRTALTSHPRGSLRLLVNGVKGVGVSYLRQYLTQLDRRLNCLKNYIIIDCQEDLLKEWNEEVYPGHIAESLLYKLGIPTPSYIDFDDPSRFKERYFPRLFEEVKRKCEADNQGIVLFIDHLSHEMDPSVFRFFDKFLIKLQQFRVPYILILGGLTSDHLQAEVRTREITLEPFKKEDLQDYFTRIYEELNRKFPELMEETACDEFVEQAVQGIEEGLNEQQVPNDQKVQKTQETIKVWYEELLEQIKIQSP
jgi:hypothetical protein